MEVNDGNLQTLAGYLEQTLSPDPSHRRAGEKFLESIERTQNYPLLLLRLMDSSDTAPHLRVSAVITLKNYVKRNWKITDEEGDKIHADDRALVKQNIVGLMLKSPEQIQKQLSDAISVIGREDFPSKWPDLLAELVTKFQSGDFHVINGVLHTAHSLFKRYRHEFKSQTLWTEIKFVLDNFAMPLTQLFNATVELSVVHANNKVALQVIYSSLVLISKIFYSLNFQDIPEFFEDNMTQWMDHFHLLLTTDNKILESSDSGDEPGLSEQLKTQICDNIAMYAQKYDEEFAPHLSKFVTAVWNLLTTVGTQIKFDLLVSNAIEFLASVAERPVYKQLFEDPTTLTSICEKIIVPNMEFRDADEEAFEDNAEEYIRRDIEGSDVDTRRRAACDLVRALSKSFESVVIHNFSNYIQHMLIEYSKNPTKNWKNKDAAIFLVTSLAAKAQTQKHGITQTSDLVNVVDFYQNHIVPDLLSTNVNEFPVLKADAIKYIMIFRNQLSRELLISAVPLLVRLLTADSQVVHSYAACCIERLLTVTVQPGGTRAITKEDLSSCSEQLLSNLFQVLSRPASQENEYVMKAIMRSLFILQELFISYVPTLITQLTEKLLAVSKNPSKPYFNHFLFESICITVSVTCRTSKEAVGSFEEALFPPFQTILQQDVQEFIPYVFQVLSLLLEQHKERVSDPYMALFPHLLLPVLWERSGNVPPLVRLLQAYIRRGWGQIGAEKLSPMLGVFQKLIASKSNDQFAFSLLNTFILTIPRASLDPHMQQIFLLIFQRLQSSKTGKYVKSLLVFLCLFSVKYGASSLVQTIDQIQANMFGMIVEKLFVPDLQKVSDKNDRKVCAVGVTYILTDCPAMLQSSYSKFWCPLLQALIGLFELPSDSAVNTADDLALKDINLDDSSGFQVTYSQLLFGGHPIEDYCPEITNSKLLLAQTIHKLSAAHPNAIQLMVNDASGLSVESSQYLQTYLQAAGLQLV